MVVTPQGLFDGTPVSWNQILWRYNQDTFNVAPIEWFFNEFYYPGLLGDVFAGKRPQRRPGRFQKRSTPASGEAVARRRTSLQLPASLLAQSK